MTHFARLGNDDHVLEVVAVNQKELLDDFGVEQEERGIEYCVRLFGGRWKQTRFDGSIRKHFAGIGFSYRDDLNAFVPPSPYPSWQLNETTCQWEPPAPEPQDGLVHAWDEDTQQWIDAL